MNADHDAQLRLLDVQAADTALAQLDHRRRNLAEIAAIAALDERDADLATQLVDAETQVADTTAEQRRLDNEVETVRNRSARDEQRLQAGGLPPKELEGLQHEIATLARRQAALEDEELEVMELLEEQEAGASRLRAERETIAAERHTHEVARDAAFVEIDASIATHKAARAEVAATLPADLAALYERAREHGGGVGAAILRQRRCEGCHIELSGTELASVRSAAADEVVRCDNCRRILIRTAESGL